MHVLKWDGYGKQVPLEHPHCLVLPNNFKNQGSLFGQLKCSPRSGSLAVTLAITELTGEFSAAVTVYW